MVEQQGSSAALERGLLLPQRRVRWWKWLLFRLSHPPVRLRQWFARNTSRSFLWLLLLFPAAYLVRLMVLLGIGYSASAAAEIEFHAAENVRVYFATLAPVILCAGLLVLAWPSVQGMFAGRPASAATDGLAAGAARRIVRVNGLCGVGLLAAAALCLLLR